MMTSTVDYIFLYLDSGCSGVLFPLKNRLSKGEGSSLASFCQLTLFPLNTIGRLYARSILVSRVGGTRVLIIVYI